MIATKPLVLVLDTSSTLYDPLRDVIEATWAHDLRLLGYTVIFYRGDPRITSPILTSDNRLVLPCSDKLHSTFKKLLLALEYLLEKYRFSFIYRTNLSSYIVPSLFHQRCSSVSASLAPYIYSGVVGRYYPSRDILMQLKYCRFSSLSFLLSCVRFASGSGFFLGSSLVSSIVQSQNIFVPRYIDDVAIGHILNRRNIFPSAELRNDIFDVYSPNSLPFIHKECFHYRIKSNNRYRDALIMKLLHNSATPVDILFR